MKKVLKSVNSKTPKKKKVSYCLSEKCSKGRKKGFALNSRTKKVSSSCDGTGPR